MVELYSHKISAEDHSETMSMFCHISHGSRVHTFRHHPTSAMCTLNSVSKPICMFYVEIDGIWSPNGCDTVVLGDGTTVQCTCNHLTAFTVLAGSSGSSLSKDELKSISVLTYVASHA